MRLTAKQLEIFHNATAEKLPDAARDRRLTHYAVICTFVPPAVWSIGTSPIKAVRGAESEFNSKSQRVQDMYQSLRVKQAIEIGEMLLVRCTTGLAEYVQEWGGEIEFLYIPGAGAFLPGEV
jgi:hypothetical protein